MSTLRVLFADTGIIAFIGLNVINLALMLLLLSWGGTDMSPVYSSLGHVLLILTTNLAFVSFSLLVLWHFSLLHLLRWINLGVAVIVALNMSMVIGLFI
jgi:hypothetical protein